MMVRPGHRELVEGNPDLNAVILYDKEGPERSWLGSIRFARRLKGYRFDTAVILHSTHRVIGVTCFAGIRRRIGYARRLPWLLTDSLPYIKREGDRHELEYNLELLRLIGIEPFNPVRPEQAVRPSPPQSLADPPLVGAGAGGYA
jgi:heptosyltransferase-2